MVYLQNTVFIVAILQFVDNFLVTNSKSSLEELHRTEISAILAYYCPDLVAMATPLASWKIQVADLNSPTP